MDANIVEFYRKARTDQGLIDALSEGRTAAEVADIAIAKAAEMGLRLDRDDVLAAMGRMKDVISAAANDDELTEFELELVAAGVPMTIISGVV